MNNLTLSLLAMEDVNKVCSNTSMRTMQIEKPFRCVTEKYYFLFRKAATIRGSEQKHGVSVVLWTRVLFPHRPRRWRGRTCKQTWIPASHLTLWCLFADNHQKGKFQQNPTNLSTKMTVKTVNGPLCLDDIRWENEPMLDPQALCDMFISVFCLFLILIWFCAPAGQNRCGQRQHRPSCWG